MRMTNAKPLGRANRLVDDASPVLGELVKHRRDAESGSASLLRRLNGCFDAAAARKRITFADARLLLNNGVRI